MNETARDAWRRRNGLPQQKRQLPTCAERAEAFRLHWERTWSERWVLRAGRYYPKDSKR